MPNNLPDNSIDTIEYGGPGLYGTYDVKLSNLENDEILLIAPSAFAAYLTGTIRVVSLSNPAGFLQFYNERGWEIELSRLREALRTATIAEKPYVKERLEELRAAKIAQGGNGRIRIPNTVLHRCGITSSTPAQMMGNYNCCELASIDAWEEFTESFDIQDCL